MGCAAWYGELSNAGVRDEMRKFHGVFWCGLRDLGFGGLEELWGWWTFLWRVLREIEKQSRRI